MSPDLRATNVSAPGVRGRGGLRRLTVTARTGKGARTVPRSAGWSVRRAGCQLFMSQLRPYRGRPLTFDVGSRCYTFMALKRSNGDVTALEDVLLLRGLLAPAGHLAQTGGHGPNHSTAASCARHGRFSWTLCRGGMAVSRGGMLSPMTTRGPRRSRRLSRAKALGVPLAALDAQRPHVVPAPPARAADQPSPGLPAPGAPVPARTRDEPCCRVRTERTVSLGGTVFMIHHHQPGCPRWTLPAVD